MNLLLAPNFPRKQFRFEFLGEAGLDATGLAREWYDQVSEQLFNPDFGFFQHSGIDQVHTAISEMMLLFHP